MSRKSLLLGLGIALAITGLARAQHKVLWEKESPYNSILVTEYERGLRTLFFEKGGARQSVVKPGDPDHIELPYARTMMAAIAVVEEPRRVLVVGLGGGTIPSFLHKHYPQTIIDVVDIDPDVVDAAKKFFGFTVSPTMRAYVRDGRGFIEECKGLYDIIFLDAFGSDNIPYHLATREFLTAVRQALKPQGIVAGNIWSSSSNPLHDAMVRTYQEVFESVYLLDVQGAGNEIILAVPRKYHISREELARRSQAISQAKGFRFDLGEDIKYGYQHLQEKDPRAQVLTDVKSGKKAG